MSASRLLIFGGLGLVVLGMLFGDIFAVFVLHQNASEQSAALTATAQAVVQKNSAGADQALERLGGLLKDHGTKVDTHAHMIGAGYLALMLAIVQPYVGFRPRMKASFARLFVAAGIGLSIGIFMIRYVDLAYSPFAVIGWGSVLADLSGFVMAMVVIVELWGVWSNFRNGGSPVEPELPNERTWARRTLLAGGTGLVLLGFLSGAEYAAFGLYHQERMEGDTLAAIIQNAMSNGANDVAKHVVDFDKIAGSHAVQIAAHSHLIEFGVLALLLSFIQPYVFLREVWRRRWILTLLAGSIILPVAVDLELRFGIVAGAVADVGGLLVVIALTGMLVGVVRYTGSLDAGEAAK